MARRLVKAFAFSILLLGVLGKGYAESGEPAEVAGSEGPETPAPVPSESSAERSKQQQLLALQYMTDFLRGIMAPSEQKAVAHEVLAGFVNLLASSFGGEDREALERMAASITDGLKGVKTSLALYKKIEAVAASIDSGELSPEEEREKRAEMKTLLREYEDSLLDRTIQLIMRDGFTAEEARQFFNQHPLMGPLTLAHRIVVVDPFRSYT